MSDSLGPMDYSLARLLSWNSPGKNTGVVSHSFFPGDLPNPEFEPRSLALPKKAMAPHSSTLAWKIPWTEEPGGLQSMDR